MVESCVPPAVHVSQSRRRLRGRRPRVTRTSSRVQAAAQSNTTRVRSILCGRPRSRAVPASIACGSRGILWKRLVVGRAAAAARSAYSGICWPPPNTRPGSRAQRRRALTRASPARPPHWLWRVFQRKASGGSLHLRRRYAQRSIVTTCSVALQFASASPWTSPSRPHTPAPAQSHPSDRTHDGPQRPCAAKPSRRDRSPATDQRSYCYLATRPLLGRIARIVILL